MKQRFKLGVLAILGATLTLGLGGCTVDAKTVSAPAKPKTDRAVYGSHIKLTGASNAQDLGGIKTQDGHRLKARRLIRSDQLGKLTTNDARKLTVTYRLKSVVDFRSSREIQATPDIKIANVTYHQDSVVGNDYGTRTTKAFYQGLVTDRVALRGYSAFFNQLLKQKTGATDFHCTYGKDRTGVGAMLVLSALGVSKQTIMKNYLYSNVNLAQDPHITFVGQPVPKGKAKQDLHHVQRVKRANLDAVYQRIDQRYGSMANFLKRLGLTPKKQAQLKQLYLTK